MSVFGRRITPEQLASDLLRGLESGDIVFGAGSNESAVAEDAAALLADRFAELVEAQIEPLRVQLQEQTDRAVTVLARLENACRPKEEKQGPNPNELSGEFHSEQEVIELALLLPLWQAKELESAASRRGMTTGQMLRRVIDEWVAARPTSTTS